MPSAPDRHIVCYVTDGNQFPVPDRKRALLDCIRRAADAGADAVQIREKYLGANRLLALVRAALEIAGAARIVVNERLDVALAAAADGVHLPAQSVPVRSVLEWLRSDQRTDGFYVGVSCHSIEEAQIAENAGASYISFGPIFDTPSKRAFGQPQGVERLSKICRVVKIPVIAIGGIDTDNATDCLRAGARGIAAIRLFQQTSNTEQLKDFVTRVHSF